MTIDAAAGVHRFRPSFYNFLRWDRELRKSWYSRTATDFPYLDGRASCLCGFTTCEASTTCRHTDRSGQYETSSDTQHPLQAAHSTSPLSTVAKPFCTIVRWLCPRQQYSTSLCWSVKLAIRVQVGGLLLRGHFGRPSAREEGSVRISIVAWFPSGVWGWQFRQSRRWSRKDPGTLKSGSICIPSALITNETA